MKTTQRLIRNKDDDNIMINLRREIEGRIHSFKLSRVPYFGKRFM